MFPYIGKVVGQNQRGSWLVIQEGQVGWHELLWSGKPAIQVGDRIYVTPGAEGEDDLVIALYVAVLSRDGPLREVSEE